MNKKLLEKTEYLLSKEKGTVFKDPGGRINIALVYPNTYAVGMSNLGFQGIYGLLNDMNDVVCERAFLPGPHEMSEHLRTGTEIFTLESKRRLSKFDIIAFSASFENDYPNIVKILEMANVPPRRGERSARHPVVAMGGVCAFYNPEPLADFFDICFTGEAEEMLPEFLSVFRTSLSKDDLFEKAAKVEGIYMPGFYEVEYTSDGRILRRATLSGAPAIIRKRTVSDISRRPLKAVITTPEAEFSNMFLIEAMRGCVWSCRFCVAGHIYKPVRKKDLDVLEQEIKVASDRTSKIGLIGPSLSDYPHAEKVLAIEGVDFSITSLRASPRSGRIVSLMKGHKSVSIAPEAGTQRLRDVINKRIRDDDILETTKIILGSGIETLRLYFMIGLPTETIEDIEGIIKLVKRIRQDTTRGYITLSVSTFVPKPFTPFQWHPMTSLKDVKERLKQLKKGLATVKGLKVFHDVPKYAYMQGFFSLGDRRASRAVEYIASGKELPLANRGDSGFDLDFYIFRQKYGDELLPWDFIDTGVPKERLWMEYKEAVGV